LDGFVRLDNAWNALKNGGWSREPTPIVFDVKEKKFNKKTETDFDVIVSGGTLGIFYALALQLAGHKVCVIERNTVLGRKQEWNISRKEINTLIRLGILTEEEVSSIIGIEFNPVRVGFKSDTLNPRNGYEVKVTDILNLGVKPDVLIELVKMKFVSIGGIVIENAAINKFTTFEDCIEVNYATSISTSSSITLSARLVLDAMGNGSPISKQIRGPTQPDGICIVVGACAGGFDPANNTYSDVIYTDTPLTKKAESQLQYFWEAFPAGSSPEDRW